MAKVNVATADNIRVRVSSIEENRSILREVQAKKEVDARKQDELNALFDRINAECASRSLKEKRKAQAPNSTDKIEDTPNAVHYGPLPGYQPGKWWGIRMDCSRDCVHEPFNENIHDGPYGAVSICTSQLNTHNDVDLGNVLTFTSREYNPTSKSKDPLILSFKNRVPIRLVRSYCLSNNYAPKTGYRYDGLYTAVRHWIGVSADNTKHHKFVLTRVLNQEPPPWLDRKVNFKTARLKKSPLRLTRSQQHSNADAQECKAVKFIYNKVEKKSKPPGVSAIVSRQVFDKFTSSSPAESSLKLTLNSDTTNQQSLCTNSCLTKLCSTNLSIRTNLYDSSHQTQEAKKTVTSVCRIFKPNQLVQLSAQPTSKDQFDQLSPTVTSRYQVEDNNCTATSSGDEQKVKKVTWADACNAGLIRMKKSVAATGNGFPYSGNGNVIDDFSTKSRNTRFSVKYNNSADYCPSSKMAKRKNTLGTRSSDRVVVGQGHTSAMNVSQHETELKISESSSIDSLAPDELVNVIVQKNDHPMAKLLIGNMIGSIGSENQGAAFVTAFNTLAKVNQDDSKQSKQNKLRNKFSIKSPAKKNGILKKQRREIANLTIDAKFETRSSRTRGLNASNKRILKSDSSRRKLLNARRIPQRSKGLPNRAAESNGKKIEKDSSRMQQDTVKKAPKMETRWTQCSFLTVPTVDQCQQTDENSSEDVKLKSVEIIDLDDVESEHGSSNSPAVLQPPSSSFAKSKGGLVSNLQFTRSAFAAVSADSNDKIARLRSIGFRPIGCDSPMQGIESGDEVSSRPEVDEEYNKYTSEENDVVGYMDEQLHFEDIEDEEKPTVAVEEDSKEDLELVTGTTTSILPQLYNIETLTEQDFNKPWHGWRQISINGQTYWTGC